ncbi:IclR family transcriptional regulator [Dietzia timorensis]|uniref:Pectin degradation repressor protein KdgR n=1 Tax=Dietzia timorensis TaxID=499555 RepID=A0A173LJV4_9ACTN|nr:IclR family transcriptional regulator [Dietzia timorensis]ANI92565.1 Pectin degradation repressor protein KdgR [Dietzia timorensis]
MSTRETVQSVTRAAAIIEAVVSEGGIVSLKTIAEKTGLAAATVHRLASTLVETGLLRQAPGREYVLAPTLMWAGGAAQSVTKRWAVPILQQVVDATGETANLAAREGDKIVYLAQVPSPYSMRMFTEVGRRVDLHCTAVGKALLANREDSEVRKLLARTGMRRYTSSTITSPDEFITELDTARKNGFAGDESEQEEGVRCVAVSHGSGRSAIAISVSGPEARFTYDKREGAAQTIASAIAASPFLPPD